MTLLQKVCCMLSKTGLSKKFCAEALLYACHLITRLPSSSTGGKTSLKVWSKKLLKTMTLFTYLVVQIITMSRKTSWVREIRKVCS